MDTAGANQRLREAFHFEAGELELNRMGRLSPAQETRLRAARLGGSLLLVLFIGLVILVGWWQTARTQPQALGTSWLLAVGFLVALGAYLSNRASLAALGGRTIEVAEGAASRLEARDWIRIGAAPLALAPGQSLAFEPGAPYRVFYLKGPRALVLSAEALEEAGSGAPLQR